MRTAFEGEIGTMRPVIVISMVFLSAAFSSMVEGQEDSEKEIRSLHGTMITMISETEGISKPASTGS